MLSAAKSKHLFSIVTPNVSDEAVEGFDFAALSMKNVTDLPVS